MLCINQCHFEPFGFTQDKLREKSLFSYYCLLHLWSRMDSPSLDSCTMYCVVSGISRHFASRNDPEDDAFPIMSF